MAAPLLADAGTALVVVIYANGRRSETLVSTSESFRGRGWFADAMSRVASDISWRAGGSTRGAAALPEIASMVVIDGRNVSHYNASEVAELLNLEAVR